MADVTQIACWPEGGNAVDWSHEGIIAVAAGQNVEFLVQL
jgi:hypothetical protein